MSEDQTREAGRQAAAPPRDEQDRAAAQQAGPPRTEVEILRDRLAQRDRELLEAAQRYDDAVQPLQRRVSEMLVEREAAHVAIRWLCKRVSIVTIAEIASPTIRATIERAQRDE